MHAFRLFERVESHGDKTALVSDSDAVVWTYSELVARAKTVASALLAGRDDLAESRVALLVPPGPDYVASQWGIWLAGGIAVPLSVSATQPELKYVLVDAQVETLVAPKSKAAELSPLCNRLGLRLLTSEEARVSPLLPLPSVARERRAMILYTSGTTSKPKGVVTTFTCLESQIESLVDAWRWRDDDSIPLFLPLHHIHGIVNVLSCALWSGARVDVFPRFNMPSVLDRVANGAYSVFMAVPTIYVKLIQGLGSMGVQERAAALEGFRQMRLMVSGSAALPASVHIEWSSLTGQVLLERYGMTEIGMAISNPFEGERRPGAVGMSLPGVEVRLVSDECELVVGEGEPGEIQVRGGNVFEEYWGRPEETRASFQDSWFRTGDIAVRETGYYRILGRSSVDIIKSGGYKLSALEIEATLLDHPAVEECAVVGLPDDTWGETVAAAIVVREGTTLDPEQLDKWCKERMSAYKAPKLVRTVEHLPRNAMGKVTKPAIHDLF